MKPCPFCGKTQTVELFNTFDAGHIAHIHCESCGADGPSVYVEGEGRGSFDQALAKARKAWYRRAHDAIRPAHRYTGNCPDDLNPHARDRHCPACRMLDKTSDMP